MFRHLINHDINIQLKHSRVTVSSQINIQQIETR